MGLSKLFALSEQGSLCLKYKKARSHLAAFVATRKNTAEVATKSSTVSDSAMLCKKGTRAHKDYEIAFYSTDY